MKMARELWEGRDERSDKKQPKGRLQILRKTDQ